MVVLATVPVCAKALYKKRKGAFVRSTGGQEANQLRAAALLSKHNTSRSTQKAWATCHIQDRAKIHPRFDCQKFTQTVCKFNLHTSHYS